MTRRVSDAMDTTACSLAVANDTNETTVYDMEKGDEMRPLVDVLAAPQTPRLNVLSSLDTSWSPADTVFSQDGSQMTPLTPYTPCESFPAASDPFKPAKTYNRYPLDASLQRLVLDPRVFAVKINHRLGEGGSAYVHEATLRAVGSPSITVAIKIPMGKSKCKAIVREAEFTLKLRARNFANSPFVECLGIHYLNRESFPMFRRDDELPALLMTKMDMDLGQYISIKRSQTKPEEICITRDLWWQLYQTLMRCLDILLELEMVHCDLKTDNVMVKLDENCNPVFKVIDFSSCVSTRSADMEMPDLTYLFSAPELLSYGTDARPNSSTDLYAVGLVLLHCMTGSAPYSTAGHDQFYQLSAAQEGRPLDWISPEDRQILKNNPRETALVEAILVSRERNRL